MAMADTTLEYKEMVDNALRGVARDALEQVAANGLPGEHHFYITFRTHAAGVDIPDDLRQRFPDEMTVVLQHQFWDLAVTQEGFSVGLSFASQPCRLAIPFAALTAFADPHVNFGLQFTSGEAETPAQGEVTEEAADAEGDDNVVTLEAFRKT
jgi:hypothetical protein